MKALFVLIAAVAVCATILLLGRGVTEALIGVLGAPGQSPAGIETVIILSVFGGMLAVAMIGGGLWGINAARLGRRPGREALLGAILGLVGVGAAAGYSALAGTLTEAASSSQALLLAWGTILILVQTGSEEVYFRGWLQRVLAEEWGIVAGLLVTTLAFAALHGIAGAADPISIANLFLAGLLFGLLAIRGAGIAGATAAHFSWNWSEEIVLGMIPNPGIGSFGALLNFELGGPGLWGGSEEGLNASIPMTLVLLALVVPLAILEYRRRSSATSARVRGRSGPAPS